MADDLDEILFYTDSEGDTHVEVFYEDETLWLRQKQISNLFDVDRSVVTKHLNNIFEEEELDEDSVCAKFAHTAEDGKTYQTKHYNLDAIIAVGYRVNSYEATRFRKWATEVLKGYIVKGFALDDDRLKQGDQWGQDYFDELLERIREIRASERHQAMTMSDWKERLDAFLKFNDYEILNDAGKVSTEVAKELAESEYEDYRVVQDQEFESDFDREIKRVLKESVETEDPDRNE